jgi:hypothetical protein
LNGGNQTLTIGIISKQFAILHPQGVHSFGNFGTFSQLIT